MQVSLEKRELQHDRNKSYVIKDDDTVRLYLRRPQHFMFMSTQHSTDDRYVDAISHFYELPLSIAILEIYAH